MDRLCTSAQKIAEYPTAHPKVAQAMNGFGGIVSFHLKGNFDACKGFLNALKAFTMAENLGGAESLAEHPASMTHASAPREECERIAVTDFLIRLSVGIGDVEDLLSDLSMHSNRFRNVSTG
jgi:cystathionine beta-lyase/cystathionine gamma-synthase